MATVRLRCNAVACPADRQAKRGVTIGELRSDLVEVGWYCDSLQDIDLCPEHAPAYVEANL